MRKVLTRIDLFKKPCTVPLNFDGKTKHRTIWGGLCSIGLLILLIIVIAIRTVPVLNKDKPHMLE